MHRAQKNGGVQLEGYGGRNGRGKGFSEKMGRQLKNEKF